MNPNIENSFLLDFYGSMLGEKQRRLFSLYYEDDLSLGEIGELEDMSRQGVRDAVKRAEHQLLEMEERLGLAERFLRVQKSLEDIRTCASQLKELCTDEQASRKADELLNIISELEKAES